MTDESQTTSFDAIVIGGGTAGMTAAKEIAKAGRRVALIEAARTGGDCLYTGCVPSKSLLASARLAHSIRHAAEFGIDVGAPVVDLPRVIARKTRIIDRIAVVDSPEALEAEGVTVIHGRARFEDAHHVRVDDRVLRAERFVIATGARPAVPPITGLADAGYVTNEELLVRTVLPRRLAVIGGGPNGLELGQAFHRFGSEVTVIERSNRILSNDDAEIASLVQRSLEREGMTIHLRQEVARVERAGDSKRLTLRAESGEERIIEADEILVATGRTPNVANLGLDAAGVAHGGDGIEVDERLRTTAPHIWACGDVTGPPYFTHVADDQARTVASNLLGGRAKWSGRAIPWTTFTDPEAAGVGLTEEAARARYGDDLEILRFPYHHLDRALTDGEDEGMIKVLLAPGWLRGRLGGEIVGAQIAGDRAGEIVHQFAVMMTWRLPAGMLAKAVQVYPTYSLGGRQAVGLHWQRQTEPAASPPIFGRIGRWLDDHTPLNQVKQTTDG